MMSENSLTSDLIRLIHERPVTDSDLYVAAEFVLDAVANIAAGCRSEPGRLMMAWASESCGVPGRDAGRNALIGAALCHMLESDDLHRASVVHPGCAIIPAVLALADHMPEVTGDRALKAVLWGYEAATRIGMAVGPEHYKVWHNTSTCGPFGSAMACALMLDLDHAKSVDALGNAGTQAAGLWQFLKTGAMSKFLHAGRAAEAGLVSAQLARHGFTGAAQILEGAQGFFAATCPDPDPAVVLAHPDQVWQLHLTSIKPWPCCRHTHGPIAAALELHRQLRETKAGAGEIARIKLATYRAALDVCDRPEPDSEYAAKFSLQHIIAMAASQGQFDASSFDETARGVAAKLAARIVLSMDESFNTAYPAHWGCKLTAWMKNGDQIEIVKSDAKGDPEDRLSRSELTQKAHSLLTRAEYDRPGQLIDQVLAMAEGGPPITLVELLN